MSLTPGEHIGSPGKLYSRITVSDSPVSQGQLTGVPRRVRDSAADLFNAIQQWNTLHLEGMHLINKIKNIKLDQLEIRSNVSNLNQEGLQEICDQLEGICHKLKSVAEKMEVILKNFEAIIQLQEMKKNSIPIFITWTDDKYARVTRRVFMGYEKEVLLKKHVQENVAHASSKEDIMLHCSLWAHQPFIEKQFHFFVESMLKETGHR